VVTVSVVVVTWNNADEIRDCLDAALAQGHDVEVAVVDNASSDGTAEVLAGYADRVTVHLSETNTGYAAANNLAFSSTSGEHVLLLNPDCVMSPGCLVALLAHLASTPTCGAAAAALHYPDGRPQSFARREITLRSAWWCLTETGSRLDVRLLQGRHRSRRWYADLLPADHVVRVDAVAAACVLLRRADLTRPLFDERFPLLYNDSDLYQRLRRRDLGADVVPSASAAHHYGSGLSRVPTERMRAESTRALLRYAGKWWGVWRRAALVAILLADCVACLAMVVLRRRQDAARTALRGTWGGLGLPGGAVPWLSTATPRAPSR
jgi:GT2 family glycosyltransferase